MNEDYLSRVQERLQRSKQRLDSARGHFFESKLKRFWHFLKTEPLIAAILSELDRNTNAAQLASA